MITRILRPDEAWKADIAKAVAFEFGIDIAKKKVECQEPKEKKVYTGNLPHDERSPFTWASLADDDETLFGCIGVDAFPARFDGHVALMGGVGGVATLPQHRRHGAIRACMKAAFEDMYQKGYLLSALYPFSFNYYRKFGYEAGGTLVTWTIDMDAIRLPDMGGRIELLLPGDDLSPVTDVYNAVCADWNLSVAREVFDEDLLKENTLEKKRYLYLWRDDSGEPRGFILFTKKDGIMDCMTNFGMPNGLMFRDAKALAALLKFARAFAADYTAIRLTLPEDIRIDSLIAEHNKVRREAGCNGMARFVNVQKALEMCACHGEGRLRIAVTDPLLPQNEGVWQIDFAPGRPNAVLKTDAPADITLPIGTFSQLLLGVRCAEDLPMMIEADVHNPDAPFSCVFRRKVCRMLDLF